MKKQTFCVYVGVSVQIGSRRNVHYTAENVSIQSGGKPVIGKFLMVCLEPGDEVRVYSFHSHSLFFFHSHTLFSLNFHSLFFHSHSLFFSFNELNKHTLHFNNTQSTFFLHLFQRISISKGTHFFGFCLK